MDKAKPRRKRGILYRVDMDEIEVADALATTPGPVPLEDGLRAAIPVFISLASRYEIMAKGAIGTAKPSLEDRDAFNTLVQVEDTIQRYLRRRARRRSAQASVQLLAGLTAIYRERGLSAYDRQQRIRDLWSDLGIVLFPEDLDALVLVDDEVRDNDGYFGPSDAARKALSTVLGITPRQLSNRKRDLAQGAGRLWGIPSPSPEETLRYLLSEVFEWPRPRTDAAVRLLQNVGVGRFKARREFFRRVADLNELVAMPEGQTIEGHQTTRRLQRGGGATWRGQAKGGPKRSKSPE